MKFQHILSIPFSVIISMIFIFLLSVVLTGLIRKYAISNSILDEPNERSSHSIPTPVGGGLSISICLLGGIFFLACGSMISLNIAVALGGGGLLISIIGWTDDHREISVTWRAVSYFIAAVWAIYWLGGLPAIELGNEKYLLPYAGNILAVLGITWLTNLYNFMDGTDAIAGVQTFTTALLTGILFWINAQHGIALICFILMASSAGFLVWNWPPAKIFMGDVGSCLIGFSFGTLAIAGEKTASVPILVWITLLALFICDATLTLIRRILKKELWYQAHRSHAYQLFVQMGAEHKKLALSVLFINIILLWPLAVISNLEKTWSVYLTSTAIITVSLVWLVLQKRYRNFKGSGE